MQLFDRSISRTDLELVELEGALVLQPVGWVSTTKILASLLHLSVVRALTEQCGLLASQQTSTYAMAALESLQPLQEESMQRAVESCRRTSHLIEALLPLGIIQFRGGTFKHITHLAKFLAQVPTVVDASEDKRQQHPLSTAASLPLANNRQGDVLRHVEDIASAPLGPFTKAAKLSEVGWLIAALQQLGYAWDNMPDEATSVQNLLHIQGL